MIFSARRISTRAFRFYEGVLIRSEHGFDDVSLPLPHSDHLQIIIIMIITEKTGMMRVENSKLGQNFIQHPGSFQEVNPAFDISRKLEGF